jgi:two-component system, NarL family, nitrate/nitrite response regulator NarL
MTMGEAPRSTVLVIDDHPLFRRGLRQLLELEPQLELVGEASSGAEGVELAARLKPDLVLLDLNMKGMNGIETLARLRESGCDGRIVRITVSDAADDLLAAIRTGADGYLLKDMEPEELLARIREALFGRMVIDESLAGVLAQALRGEAQAASRSGADLTDRERDILGCLAAGMSNKLVARELDIAEGTVKVHVKNLLKKLNFRSRVEAAVWAVERGFRRG